MLDVALMKCISSLPLTCQVGPGIGPDHGAPDQAGAGGVHEPGHDGAVVVLPQDVGVTIAVEVAAAFDVPGGPRVGPDHGAADRTGTSGVDEPGHDGAVIILPQDVGVIVAVEVTAALDVPGGPRVGPDRRLEFGNGDATGSPVAGRLKTRTAVWALWQVGGPAACTISGVDKYPSVVRGLAGVQPVLKRVREPE